MSLNKRKLIIFGAWYFSDVIEELALLLGWNVLGRIDPDPPSHQKTLQSVSDDAFCFVSIGDNEQRRLVSEKLLAHGRELAHLIHPTASVSPSVNIGSGVYIGENVSVRTGCHIGKGVMINANAVVSHHVSVGDYVTFGPNSAVASKSRVGTGSLIGVGASVKPNSTIGENCTVGAGSVVTQSVSDGVTVVGVPAKPMTTGEGSDAAAMSNWHDHTIW